MSTLFENKFTIIKCEKLKDLKRFIYFTNTLYKDCVNFVPPIYSSLIKELKVEVLKNKTYTALLCVEGDKVLGRILYTISDSKKRNAKIGYFSFFDLHNNQEVANTLLSKMEDDLKGKVTYIEGPFTPYDPDTRRGVLVKGFDKKHTFLTSYNFSYYSELLTNYGYNKAYDTFALEVPLTDSLKNKVERIASISQKRYNIEVKNFSYKEKRRDLQAIHDILKEATNELNYQDAPNMEMINSVFKSLKFFIEPSLVKIAWDRNLNTPIGFSLTILDYNEYFKITKGKINVYKFFKLKKSINGVRGILQYVIPKYQNKGALAQIFNETRISMENLNLNYFEGGTIMEDNPYSYQPFINLGGEISRIFRIYGKEI